jgi:hypothetical protein
MYKYLDLNENKSVMNWTQVCQFHLKPNCMKMHQLIALLAWGEGQRVVASLLVYVSMTLSKDRLKQHPDFLSILKYVKYAPY